MGQWINLQILNYILKDTTYYYIAWGSTDESSIYDLFAKRAIVDEDWLAFDNTVGKSG